MCEREQLLVRVDNELVLDAGTCEVVPGERRLGVRSGFDGMSGAMREVIHAGRQGRDTPRRPSGIAHDASLSWCRGKVLIIIE